MFWGVNTFYLFIAYYQEVMTKNELSLLVARSRLIRIRATMCVVGLVNGEPAAACFTCVSRMVYGTARRPDRRATRKKCHMLRTYHLQSNLT